LPPFVTITEPGVQRERERSAAGICEIIAFSKRDNYCYTVEKSHKNSPSKKKRIITIMRRILFKQEARLDCSRI
jgi:hypothetical protein